MNEQSPIMPSSDRDILDPPVGILSSLRYMGPGLILSAAIVGSGELIVTTTLGAKAGFSLLWIIVFGCMVKVAVQLEYGRFCIHYGLPTLQAWNHVGRIKWFSIHWTVYVALLYMLSTFAGQAGVLGGAAQAAVYAFPALSLPLWILLIASSIGLILSCGGYNLVEGIAALLNFIFITTVFYCVFALFGTPYSFTLGDLWSGFRFQLPRETVGLALAAFGITGIAAGEITVYTYWCQEKGYARWTGIKDGSPEWYERARGWIRVMTIDAVASMIIYTLATAAFYILGACVLRSQETLSDGNEFIFQLSAIFTDLLGGRARWIFMLCSFAVLFSTIFANAAGFSRMWTDFFGLCRWIDWENEKQRRRSISLTAWLFPFICGFIYFVFQKPLLLVVFMGICNALFLVVVAYQTVIFRYKYADAKLKPSRFYDAALWLSLISIGFLAVQTVSSLIP
ncbi:MAG: Nramp family divalent metal transporter [Candidatus Omnitrophica bacterium]|nr:Nramp family divalent metal transporter [Candidatus Omnitrophota bacterium]